MLKTVYTMKEAKSLCYTNMTDPTQHYENGAFQIRIITN